MSSSDGGPGNREVAYRLFACEYEDATFSFKESDEERAPNFVISPTGGRVNRLFLAGVLTEKAEVGGEQLRARVNDLTGTFVTYAGQYQPDPLAFLDRTEPPTFVAVTGKARTFTPEDGDRTYSSVRPESISEVDAATRDRWVVRTAEQTIHRVGTMAAALRTGLQGEDLRAALVDAGVDESLAAGTALAVEHYGTTAAYLEALRDRSVQAVEVVAGERDEVEPLRSGPTEGDADPALLDALATLELELPTSGAASDIEPPAGRSTGGDDERGTTPDQAATAAATTGGESTTAEADSPSASEPTTEADSTDTGAKPVQTESPPVGDSTETVAEPSAGAEPESESEPEPEPDSHAGGEATASGTVDEPTDSGTAQSPDAAGEADDDLEDFEPGEFEMPEEEREQVEEEYGTDFETAAEFDPDEGSIETGEASSGAPASVPDGTADPTAEDDSESALESEADAVEAETAGADAGDPESTAPPADVPVDEAVLEVIADLDDGDGAEREAVVSELVEGYGVDADEAAQAIEDAMMNGQCYEPTDGRVKAI